MGWMDGRVGAWGGRGGRGGCGGERERMLRCPLLRSAALRCACNPIAASTASRPWGAAQPSRSPASSSFSAGLYMQPRMNARRSAGCCLRRCKGGQGRRSAGASGHAPPACSSAAQPLHAASVGACNLRPAHNRPCRHRTHVCCAINGCRSSCSAVGRAHGSFRMHCATKSHSSGEHWPGGGRGHSSSISCGRAGRVGSKGWDAALCSAARLPPGCHAMPHSAQPAPAGPPHSGQGSLTTSTSPIPPHIQPTPAWQRACTPVS